MTDPDTAAELRLIRTEITAIRQQVIREQEARERAQQTAPPPSGHSHHRRRHHVRHGWLRHLAKGLEDDPHLQYKVHLWAVRVWLVNMAVAVLVFTLAQGTWVKISVLYLVLISLYANLATDYGSMSASMAAFTDDRLPAIPMAEAPDATAHYQQQTVIHDLLEQNNALTEAVKASTDLLEEIHRHISAIAPRAGQFPPEAAVP